MEKKKNTKRILSIVSLCICLCVIIVSIIMLYIKNNNSNYYLNVNIEKNDNVTNPINYSEIITNIRNEYNNEDIKGILEIEN